MSPGTSSPAARGPCRCHGCKRRRKALAGAQAGQEDTGLPCCPVPQFPSGSHSEATPRRESGPAAGKEEEEEKKEEGCSFPGTQSPFHRGRVWISSASPAPRCLLPCQERCGRSGGLAGRTPGGAQRPSGGFIPCPSPRPNRPCDFPLLSAFNYTPNKSRFAGKRELCCSGAHLLPLLLPRFKP